MDARTISRIEAAQFDAQKVRLSGTAGRLEVLRRELQHFHEAAPERREAKGQWALAKLADIEKTLGSEVRHIMKHEEAYFWQVYALSRAGKLTIYLATTISVIELLKQATNYVDTAFIMAGGMAVATALSSGVEKLLGGSITTVALNIKRAIDECRDALQRR